MHRRLVPRLVPSLALVVATTTLVAPAPAGAERVRAQAEGEVTVSAAASLTEAFTRIGRRLERRNPDATVTFNFGSSASLATQIRSGAPADVYASADLATMDRLVSGGEVTATPTPFARNRMAIAVKPGNPERVRSVADLAGVGTISLCGATVPCGSYADAVLRRAGVTIPESDITRGIDAKGTLGAVARGDAAAAIVYASDVVAAASTVEGIDIPPSENVVAVYPIAPLADSANRRLARAFVDDVTSRAGQRILARFGFLPA